MKIIFYRHGKTAGNLKGNYIGKTDEPLCPEGIAALHPPQDGKQVKKVYTSPLLRTVQTARILFPGAEIVSRSGLSEMDFGVFEGKNYVELQNDSAYRAWLESGCEDRCPGGESRAEFVNRICFAFKEIVNRALADEEEELWFVVHGGTIMAIFSKFALPSRPYFDWRIENGQALTAKLEEREWDKTEKFCLCISAEEDYKK